LLREQFAGEIDTLEILEQMKRNYPIDANRVVEMGFSMGGAAACTWRCITPTSGGAASPGAGFAETREYQKMDKSDEWRALPAYRKSLFHLYDCPDWCWNLQMVPLIAYAGEIDPQQQSRGRDAEGDGGAGAQIGADLRAEGRAQV